MPKFLSFFIDKSHQFLRFSGWFWQHSISFHTTPSDKASSNIPNKQYPAHFLSYIQYTRIVCQYYKPYACEIVSINRFYHNLFIRIEYCAVLSIDKRRTFARSLFPFKYKSCKMSYIWNWFLLLLFYYYFFFWGHFAFVWFTIRALKLLANIRAPNKWILFKRTSEVCVASLLSNT